jgi:tryptophanyl-tRNA synthetase
VTDRSVEDVAGEYSGQGYGALKGAVADAVVEFVRPLQDRYAELDADRAEVARILEVGADRAQAIAAPVMARVREAVGLLPRGG